MCSIESLASARGNHDSCNALNALVNLFLVPRLNWDRPLCKITLAHCISKLETWRLAPLFVQLPHPPKGHRGTGVGGFMSSSSGEALVTVSFGAENPKYRRLCLLTGEVGLPNIMLLLYYL